MDSIRILAFLEGALDTQVYLTSFNNIDTHRINSLEKIFKKLHKV